MAWVFQNWVLCDILISAGMFLITILVLFIMLWRFPKVFYAVVDRVFKIKRCVIDVNHQIIRDNVGVSASHEKHRTIRRLISDVTGNGSRVESISTNRTDCINSNAERTVLEPAKKPRTWSSPNAVVVIANEEKTNYKPHLEYLSEGNSLRRPARSNVKKRNSRRVVRSVTAKANHQKPTSSGNGAFSAKRYTALNLPEDHPAHPAYQRVILDVYGKYLPLRKKRNQFLILLLSSIVIAAVLMTFWDGCLLASVTVYQDSPCPAYGDMDCFYGPNETYFLCQTGNNVNFLSSSISATCFRWIARDLSVSDVLKQVGVCAGLLTAFGSLTEVFLRILFWAYEPRRSVANGMRRVLEKTVGINNVTQPLCTCCIKFPIRVPPPNLGLYRRPILVILAIIIYVLIAASAMVAYIPLIYFRASVTSFTYIILSSIALLCLFTMVWVLWEVDEIRRVLPGGCMKMEDILKSSEFKNVEKLFMIIKDPTETKKKLAELNSSKEEEESESKKMPAESKSQTSYVQKGTEYFTGLFKRVLNVKDSTPNKRSTEGVTKLGELTKLSEQDIEEWHDGFLQDCPKGELDRKQFITIFEKFFVKGSRAESFCNYFFQTFDADENDSISFPEFLVAIAPNTQRDCEARLSLAFDMYDISDPSGIDKKELKMWIEAMYDVADMFNSSWRSDRQAKTDAEEIIKRSDTDHDNILSKDEFVRGCKEHQELMEILLPSPQTDTKND